MFKNIKFKKEKKFKKVGEPLTKISSREEEISLILGSPVHYLFCYVLHSIFFFLNAYDYQMHLKQFSAVAADISEFFCVPL